MPGTLEMKMHKGDKKVARRRKIEIANSRDEVSRWLEQRLKAALLNGAMETKPVGHAPQIPESALID